MKRKVVKVALIIGVLSLTGCNTISGFATDVKAMSDGTKDHLTK